MEQTFEYIKVQTAMDTYHAEDIGNLLIEALNDDGLEWYLQICTDTGYCSIKEFGPLMGDNETIMKNNFSYNCFRQEYNERSICKTITKFLNNPSRAITQVIDIDYDTFLDKIRLIKEIL